MTISFDTVIAKLEQEVAAAKRAGEHDADRHIYAIQSLCELLTEAPGQTVARQAVPPPVAQAAPSVMPAASAAPAPVQNVPSVRLSSEDGSNGDSLFDF